MKTRILCCFAAAAILLSGCAKSSGEASEESETAEASVSYEDMSIEERMIAQSLVSVGNTSRLNEKLAALENGGEVTVGFIGGSITYGYTVKPEECFASRVCGYLKEKYSSGTVNYVNKGISGTPSILGNLRLERDILQNNADIIFVEYAVNDGMEDDYKESYDSLVYTALKSEKEPAVVLVLNRTKEGHSAQEHMKEIGEYYSLPMISTADAFTDALDRGDIKWEDYYNDSSHPSPEGHRLFCDMTANAVEKSLETQSDEYTVPEQPIYGAPYKNAVLIESDYDNSNENFKLDSLGSFTGKSSADGFSKGFAFDKTTNEPMKFTVTGNSLFIVCKRNNNNSMGKFDVYLNGSRVSTINTNDPDGWGDPYAYKIIKWQDIHDMEVELRPTEDSLDKSIDILAIGFSAN